MKKSVDYNDIYFYNKKDDDIKFIDKDYNEVEYITIEDRIISIENITERTKELFTKN